jgi:lysyl-tRNA synthetase class II
VFYDLYSDGHTVQIMSSARRYVQSEATSSEDDFTFMNKLLKRGDIIGA